MQDNKIVGQFISWATLLSGLCISGVAVYYSVAGLMSIFAASAIPVMIMGTFLETSKLVATVWLKQYWDRAPFFLRTYLTGAVVILMAITSLGIFGYLSKAHIDQGVPTGDIAAQVEMFDAKIKSHQDIIQESKKALAQMDSAVDQVMQRTSDAYGANRAVAIRKNQKAERDTLQNEIASAQASIIQLNEEKAPVAAKLRAATAEVGPIKYIANALYGDNIDAGLLERAVRWIITLIVIVFDPLAVILLLASQYSFSYLREDCANVPVTVPEQEPVVIDDPVPPVGEHTIIKLDDSVTVLDSTESIIEETEEPESIEDAPRPQQITDTMQPHHTHRRVSNKPPRVRHGA